MKKLYLFLFAFLQLVPGFGQETPTAAPDVKTFALQPDVTGAASNSVNLFTGDVALPLNLISLPGHNGLDVNVSISYSSNVQRQASTWNLEAPAGMLGLGWSMGIPKIVADHKQTGAREDDEYYLLEGGASNRLIRTTSGSDAGGSFYAYEAKQYQFWKIKYYYDYGEITGGASTGANRWEITKEDGTRYIYGDRNSGRGTLQYAVRWKNWIGSSAQTADQTQMAYIWNLSEIINVWNEKVTFAYENVEQFVGSSAGKKHTEASYLKQITDVFGRKVVFHYKDKAGFVFNGLSSAFYMEPHTERAEPDAYQEVYERNYLDRIEVLREDNSNFLSVQLNYSAIGEGTNLAKMLLSSVVQQNSAGQAFPEMQFVYNTTGVTKGFLQKVTYPTGGTVSYSYKTSGNTIAKSSRQLTITAPTDYVFAEPKTWIGPDYVVVAWRQLGTNGTHDAASKMVRLYVYQWVGEWKEFFSGTLTGVELEGSANFQDYKNFQVVVEDKFFAVLQPGTNNYYHLRIHTKDEANRGSWLTYSSTIDCGEGIPSLLSGSNFVAVGTFKDDTSHPAHLYTFQGNSWKLDQLNQTIGDHYYASANNYFISQNRAGFDGLPETNFTYLTEDSKWVTKKWLSSLLYASSGPSFWHAANSFAMVMASSSPELAYRWDLTYTNFFKDSKDVNNNDLFGSFSDTYPVFILNNSMVGIYGKLARFDGKYWRTAQIASTQNDIFSNYFSYGDDIAVRPTEYVTATSNYKGARKVFDPNQLLWLADFVHDGSDRGNDFASVGIDNYYFGNGYYYRQPDGTWIKKFTYTSNNIRSIGGYPKMHVWWNGYPFKILEVRSFKNGEISSPLTISNANNLYQYTKFRNPGVGNETILTYPSTYAQIEDAKSITLYRMGDNAISDSQVDYPVTLLTLNDGTTNRYTSFDYNLTTAAVDASGTVAQYNEVTVIPGSSVATSTPYGYTKTFFFNGRASTELEQQTYQMVDLRWSGAPYETKTYDSNDLEVGYSKTTYSNFFKDIKNGDGTKVEIGYYARPTETRSMADGVETVSTHTYDLNTGLVAMSRVVDYNSKGSANYTLTRYKYFWEQYDTNREKNILSPVIQTKQSVVNNNVEVVGGVSAVTWKSWNGIYAPHKTYQWKGTGTADFNFASWSDANEPASDWVRGSIVEEYDLKGNAIQISTR